MCALYLGLLGAGDYLVLHHVCERYEVSAVAGYADDDVLVILRLFLSGVEGCPVDACHLDLLSAVGEVGLDDGSQLAHVAFCLKSAGAELHVEQGCGVLVLSYLAAGIECCKNALCIGTLLRGDHTIGEDLACLSAVRGSSYDLAAGWCEEMEIPEGRQLLPNPLSQDLTCLQC